MRLLFVLNFLALGMLLAAFPAAAEPPDDDTYSRPGVYVGVAVVGGFATLAQDELEDVVPFSVDVEPSPGVMATLGYRIHPNFAAEVQFEWLDGFDITVKNTELATLETWATTVNAKGYFATGRFQPYLLAGLGAFNAELEDSLSLGLSSEETDFAARFGGGFDIYATPLIVYNMGVSYVLPTGDVEKLDYVSLTFGLTLRF